jgi:hypothetical protein
MIVAAAATNSASGRFRHAARLCPSLFRRRRFDQGVVCAVVSLSHSSDRPVSHFGRIELHIAFVSSLDFFW